MSIAKPTYGTQIDWSNPLAKGLDFCLVPSLMMELVKRVPVTNTGTTQASSGLGGGTLSTGTGQYITSKFPNATYQARSFFYHADWAPQASYGGYALIQSDGGGSGYFREYIMFSGAATTWIIPDASGGSYQPIIGSDYGDAGFASNLWNRSTGLTLTWDSKGDGRGRAYNGGKLIVTASTARTANSAPSNNGGNYRFGIPNNTFSGRHVVNTVMNWNRKLSDAEIAELNYDPWVIFDSPRKTFMFLAGAGFGAGVDTITGTADQTFPNFVSSASTNEIWQGSTAQTLANFTSSATASEIYQTSASQSMGAFVGSATANHSLPTFTASAAQSFGNFTSAASAATDAVTFTAIASQTLDNFTGAITASEIYQSSASQSMGAFTSTASATRSIPTVTGTAAQTLENFTSEAYTSFGTTTLYASASQTMGPFVSGGSGKIGNTATANQTMSDFVSTADVREAFAIAGDQSFGNFTSTAVATSGQVGIAGSAASMMGEFVSSATALQKYQAVSSAQMGNFVSDAHLKHRYIASANQSFGNFTSTVNVLTGDHPIGHFIYVRNIGVINTTPRRV